MYYYKDMDNFLDKELTQREHEILLMITKGYSNSKMAEVLSISTHTVKAHIGSIYKKFGVHNKVQAAMYAVYNNIIDAKTIL